MRIIIYPNTYANSPRVLSLESCIKIVGWLDDGQVIRVDGGGGAGGVGGGAPAQRVESRPALRARGRAASAARHKQTLPFDRYNLRPRTANCQRSTLL